MQSCAEQAARIELVVFDVDGTLTRGDLIYMPEGESKVFNVRDGLGIVIARRLGLKIAWLSARHSAVTSRRARDLGIDFLKEGVDEKGAAFRQIMDHFQVKAEQVCYLGDDLIDLAPLRMAGLAAAVADAVPEVQAVAHFVTTKAGGCGAAREVLEFILKAKGKWTEENYN